MTDEPATRILVEDADPGPASSPAPGSAGGLPAMDWEGFFKRYRDPDFVPGYAILNKLGGGVFGDVYKARKTSIGKFYAVKFLKIQDERLSEQVLRELRAVDHFAQVDHPNLVSIEDRGDVGGIPYIVMGYAGDETLKVLLRDGAVPRERALFLFRQMLQGVQALHEHAIVHFDLKPANVFIKGDVARVGDYGLSKLMSESRATLSMGRGTPYYMAPEMLRRRGDARSDVYSLGILLFEMLTGGVPFQGDSEWEILKRHETDDVAVPAGVPAPLAAFIRRSLAKDPGRRFPHAGAQLEALDRAVAAMEAGGDRPAPPPPLPSAPPPPLDRPLHLEVGAAAGRLAVRGRATMEGVHRGLRDVLERLREVTDDSVQEAVASYRRERAQRGDAASQPVQRAPKRRRRPWCALVRGVGACIRFPWQVLRFLFRHTVRIALVLVICLGLGWLVHLGLSELILGGL